MMSTKRAKGLKALLGTALLRHGDFLYGKEDLGGD
jgi:hypothetical protein